MDEKYGLPEVWARHSKQRTKQDNCNVCDTSFSMVSVFGMGNRDYFCKHCGIACCATCSTNKKFLSRSSDEKFRVCDLCDTQLDNIRLRMNFDKLIVLKDEKIALTEKLLKRLKEQKDALIAEIDSEKFF